jgi:hypothetical protein
MLAVFEGSGADVLSVNRQAFLAQVENRCRDCAAAAKLETARHERQVSILQAELENARSELGDALKRLMEGPA